MWSDRTPPGQLRELVGRIRSVLPSPELGATISYSSGCGIVSGPNAHVRLSGCGFDILHAAFEAWRGTSAILKGFLAYDLALELEQLGPAPSADFDFPSLHFEICEPVGVAPSGAGFQPVSSVTTNLDRVAFEASVERIVKTIRAGDIFQTNLCRCIEAEIAPGTEWDLFQRMRSINPAQYETFLRIGEGQAVLSTSPELFLKVEDRIVESRPIKGTRPRAATDEADQAVAKELTASEKDRAELAMIVDVVRNDLGRVCETGSVEVVSHAELMKLPTVHHLFSTVRGRLREDVELIDLLRAAFPAASITGAPKIEAMRVAMREEGRLRGPCMGAIGWISMDGRMEMSVAIRTAFVTGGRVRYYAGCGITSDSVPNSEFDESSAKAAAFLRALGLSQVSGR